MNDLEIDRILNVFITYDAILREPVINLKAGLSNSRSIEVVIALGLIKQINKVDKLQRTFALTVFGNEVLRHGSWTQYLVDKEEEKKLSTALIKSSIGTNNLQKILLWFTAAFSALTLLVAIMDYSIHADELQLQKMTLDQKGEGGQRPLQDIRTASPNQDSSKILKIDSLNKDLKVKQ